MRGPEQLTLLPFLKRWTRLRSLMRPHAASAAATPEEVSVLPRAPAQSGIMQAGRAAARMHRDACIVWASRVACHLSVR